MTLMDTHRSFACDAVSIMVWDSHFRVCLIATDMKLYKTQLIVLMLLHLEQHIQIQGLFHIS